MIKKNSVPNAIYPTQLVSAFLRCCPYWDNAQVLCFRHRERTTALPSAPGWPAPMHLLTVEWNELRSASSPAPRLKAAWPVAFLTRKNEPTAQFYVMLQELTLCPLAVNVIKWPATHCHQPQNMAVALASPILTIICSNSGGLSNGWGSSNASPTCAFFHTGAQCPTILPEFPGRFGLLELFCRMCDLLRHPIRILQIPCCLGLSRRPCKDWNLYGGFLLAKSQTQWKRHMESPKKRMQEI